MVYGVTVFLILTLFATDSLPAVWFSYHYLHKPTVPVVTQCVRLNVPEMKFKLVAQLMNHIFNSRYLPAHLRTKVYWKGLCGQKIEEHELLQALLEVGDGASETLCLCLNISALLIFTLKSTVL
ncbi:hypothetical protein BS17DRAFT_713123 [Gyrodon lividus]|nr:hypothetical protein BS17DRAFT_713123 [Gyrodon lividus]